jgi:hypothetical protein
MGTQPHVGVHVVSEVAGDSIQFRAAGILAPVHIVLLMRHWVLDFKGLVQGVGDVPEHGIRGDESLAFGLWILPRHDAPQVFLQGLRVNFLGLLGGPLAQRYPDMCGRCFFDLLGHPVYSLEGLGSVGFGRGVGKNDSKPQGVGDRVKLKLRRGACIFLSLAS